MLRKLVALAGPALALALLSGCAQFAAPAYSPDYDSLDRLRLTKPAPVAVGAFQPTDAANRVNTIGLRGANLVAAQGTFAKYLEDAMVADLKEISVFDPASRTRIDATLLTNDLDIRGASTGAGQISAEITVTRNGVKALHKTYTGSTTFESSFAGAVAIPKAQSEYPFLVRALLRSVYSDPAFIASLSRP